VGNEARDGGQPDHVEDQRTWKELDFLKNCGLILILLFIILSIFKELNTFTLLYTQSPELFITKLKLYTNYTTPPPAALGNHHSTFCLHDFGGPLQKWQHTVCVLL
jgi:hypothetical protein